MRSLAALLLLATLACAQEAAAQQQITMPALDFAEFAIERGDFEDARAVLNALHERDPKNIQTRFLLAEIDSREGNYKSAVARYREILRDNPDLPRVRLDLAAALFLLGEDNAATYNFQLALAANPPDAVRENVMRFLGAIRARKKYDLNITASLAPDTNINNGAGANQLTLFGLPFTLDKNAQQKSGIGFTTSITGEYRYALDENWRIRTNATGFRAEYPGGRFDDMVVRTQVGPQWFSDNRFWDTTLFGVFTKRWFGNDPYQQGYGPRLELNYNGIQKWNLSGAFEYLKLNYHNQPTRNGDFLSTEFSPNYFISSTAYLHPILGYFRERDVDDSFSNNGYRIGLGYHQELPYGITLDLQPELIWYDYLATNPLFQTTRRDRTERVTVTAYNRAWNLWGFSPTFSYIFTNNDSNQELFAYQRHQFQIGVTEQF